MIELVCVDQQDRALTVMEKLSAHADPGHLHRAFSVMLVDDQGRCLLQQRAAAKYHFAGLWANTCCGHPGPDEDIAAAAAQRTFEELGVRPGTLHPAGSFVYRAQDPVSGLVEHEYDHVLVGRLDGWPTPDPDEVDDVRLVTFDELEAELAREPERFAPWLPGVVRIARPAVAVLSPGAAVPPAPSSSDR